jgi:anti-sigma regulatory factor (Ser/Thr protein kinase)
VFTGEPESVGAARRFATETLGGVDPKLRDAVELMVSEVATNSVQHAETAFELTVSQCRDEIRVEVTDRAGGKPRMRSARPEDPTGRGLQIVNLLSDAWGVQRHPTTGKTVWFTVSGPSPVGPGSR